MRRFLIILVLLVLAAGSLGAEDGDSSDFDHIYAALQAIDDSSTFAASDFSAQMTVITEDPDQGTEKTVVRQFRRDSQEQFVLLIQEPRVQRGQGYLMDGDNLWFYDPSSRRFSHTSLKESFQTSDARNSDFLARSLAEDYQVVGYEEGRLGANDVYVVDLEAVSDAVTYPFMKIWVTMDNALLLKSEDYSLNKRLMRTSLFPGYAKLDDYIIPRQMIFVDELVEGQQTQITLSEMSMDPIPDHVFTRAYLERVSR